MSKTFCTSLYNKYIVYFYLNVVGLLLFDLEFSQYSRSQNKSGCMLKLGASISLRGQRVERSSPRCGQMSALCPLPMPGFLSPAGPLTQRQVTGPNLSVPQRRHAHYQSLKWRFWEEEDDTACVRSEISDGVAQ